MVSADAQTPRWVLKPLASGDFPDEIEVTEAGLTVGRDPANDVVVPERFARVSAHHVRLVLRDGAPYLEDLGSTNGTQVGGQRVQKQQLAHGDVVELGTGGPRFAVVGSEGAADTQEVPAAAGEGAPPHTLGPDTVQFVREELGIPAEDGGVSEILRTRTRWQSVVAVVLVLLVLGVGTVAFRSLIRRGKEEVRKAEEVTRLLEQQLAEAQAEMEAQRLEWQSQRERLESAVDAWETQKKALEEEQKELVAGLQRIEEGGEAAAGERESLASRLEEARRQLERYDPVNLEQSKLRNVSEVEPCVVLIEVEETFEETESGQLLYFDRDPIGMMTPNFEERGDLFQRGGTGSGFCFHVDGWILTNAHVVHQKGVDTEIDLGPDVTVVSRLDLQVIFSGRSERHPATLVRWAADGDEDLALLKIEPFEGMPHLDGIDLAVAPPQRGTDVFLLGFPLGRQALHRGETMIASAFRGIVSRLVEPYLQVDAAVHPGASGGPVIDGNGRVLGVVVGMQMVSRTSASSAIGYVIPIAEAGKVWPPP